MKKCAFNTFILNKANELKQKTIDIRGYLHENPEISSKEFKTSSYLKEKIKEIGLTVEEVPGSTGFTALLETGTPGKILGIRTDIDALPIEENPENLAGKRKYLSKNQGAMHACGHDGHMAIVLTVIEIMHELKDQLKGSIYFIFEEGEETGAGINPMLKHLKGRGIDAVYGNHLTAFMDSGTICVDEGPRMAGAILVDFSVHGRSGHGSRPDLSVNPVFAAGQILNALTNAWTNQLDVTKTVTLGLTQIHGGSANNVIPAKVDIGGSLRFFDVEEGRKALEVCRKVIDYTAQAHQCTVTFAPSFEMVANPVVNDSKLASLAQQGIHECIPEALVHDMTWFASEPFNQYSEMAPTIFAFIGARNEGYGSGAEHHNDRFDVDDDALIYGVLATAKFAADFLIE